MITKGNIQEEALKLPSTRGDKREKLIKSISDKLLSFYKQEKVIAFPRSEVNNLVQECDAKERSKRQIVEQLLKHMLSNKKIVEDVQVTPIYTFRNKPLISFDSSSYSLMMKKNGYYRVLYRYMYKEGRPVKKMIKRLSLNDPIPQELDFDEIEIKSMTRKEKQGVYTNGNISVIKDFCFYSERKVYRVIY